MLAELAGMGMQIGGFLYGKGKIKDASARAQEAARLAAQQQVTGLNSAIGERRAGTTNAVNFLTDQLDPFASSGRGSMTLLSDALGVNGPEAQARYFQMFQNDPGFMATQKAGTDAIEQSAAGGGMLRSGGTLKGLFDHGQKGMFAQISDRLSRLGTLGAQGQSAATALGAGGSSLIDTGSASVAGYLRDIGTANAGGTINASNADQMGTQNLLQLLGYTMGSIKQPMNDLLGSFKMPGGGSSASGGLGFALPGQRA